MKIVYVAPAECQKALASAIEKINEASPGAVVLLGADEYEAVSQMVPLHLAYGPREAAVETGVQDGEEAQR